MGKACLPNLEPFFAAGIDPKTGLPINFQVVAKVILKKMLRNFYV